jgi:hypothetical protein
LKTSEYYRNRKLSYQELVTFSSARTALPLRLRAPWAAGETAHTRVCAAARVLSPASAVQKRMTSQFGDRRTDEIDYLLDIPLRWRVRLRRWVTRYRPSAS